MTNTFPPHNVPVDTRSGWSIQTLFLLVINVPLGLALAILLPLDYRREMEDAITRKQASLEEEAMTIHQAVSSLASQGRDEVI